MSEIGQGYMAPITWNRGSRVLEQNPMRLRNVFRKTSLTPIMMTMRRPRNSASTLPVVQEKPVLHSSDTGAIVAQVLKAVREPGSTFLKLQVFADALEKEPKELVSELIQRSSGAEILTLLKDATKLKSADIALIFTILEKIILVIASDLTVLESTAMEMAEILLTHHQRTFYYMLKTTNKSNQIKSALKLLIAIATLGPKAVKTILAHFEFPTSNLTALFTRRNTIDPQDVRSCVVHFLVALLMFGDNAAIRQLMQIRNMLTGIFAGLLVDRSETIELFLSTLLDRVVKNVAVPKTLKVQLFTQTTLKQLVRVLQWNGPKKSEKEFTEDETTSKVLSEDQENVRAAVLQIMNIVCTSIKFGIVFQDPLVGTGPKNCNHILTDLLKSLSFLNTNHREMAADILIAAPDQLNHFLPAWKPGFVPRESEKWFTLMSWLGNLYSRLDIPSRIGKIPTKSRIKPLLALSFQLCFDKELQREALKEYQPTAVSVKFLSLLNELLIRAHCVLNFLSPQEKTEFLTEMSSVTVESHIVMDCWKLIVRRIHSKHDLVIFSSYFVINRILFPGQYTFSTDEIQSNEEDISKVFDEAQKEIMDHLSRTESQTKIASSAAVDAEFSPEKMQVIRDKTVQKERTTALRTATSLLLLELCALENQRLPVNVMEILMESYSATLSAADQNIFSVIRLVDQMESPGISFSVFGNFARRRAEFRLQNGTSRVFQPSLREFIDSLDSSLVRRTVNNFPIRVPLFGNVGFVDENIYDPRYLLANFTELLLDSHFNATHFVESGCLAIVVAALGSLDGAMRAAAYCFLELFENEVNKLKFKGREQLMYIISQIRRSNRPEKAWPNLWTTALNRFFAVMFDGDNHEYQFLMEYFLVKPEFRLHSVPEFWKLFESGGLGHIKERKFILELLRDGIRHYQDYELCDRSHAFGMIFSMSGSVLSNKALNLLISEVVLSASKVPFVGRRLVKNLSIFVWISQQLEIIDDPETLSNLIQCSRNCLKDIASSKRKNASHFSVNLMITALLRATSQLEIKTVTESTLSLIMDVLRWGTASTAQFPTIKRYWTMEEVKRIADLVLRRLKDIRTKTDDDIWKSKVRRIALVLGELEKIVDDRIPDEKIFSLIVIVDEFERIDVD